MEKKHCASGVGPHRLALPEHNLTTASVILTGRLLGRSAGAQRYLDTYQLCCVQHVLNLSYALTQTAEGSTTFNADRLPVLLLLWKQTTH